MRPRDWTRVVPTKTAVPPARSSATSAMTAAEVERLRAEPEGAARYGRDERHLVAVGQLPVGRGVLAVHGVEEARRLVSELERGPDVAHALDAVELSLRPAGALAQAGEETHADLHHDESRHYDRGAGSRAGRWCDDRNLFHT